MDERQDESTEERKANDSQHRNESEEKKPTDARRTVAEGIANEEGEQGTPEQREQISRLRPLFDGAVFVLYIAVGIMLVAMAFGVLGYAIYQLPGQLREGLPSAIATLLGEALLVLILIELLGTIINYITTHQMTIRPFLVVAAISSVRRILSIGAELSLPDHVPPDEFNRMVIELVVEGFIIFVVAASLYLFSRREAS
jgi:uncharacterized membrane protein (DUF373 family)